MSETVSAVRKVTKVTPLETFLVEYRDGESKENTRVVFRVPNSKACFILQERLDGVFVTTAANAWFGESLTSYLKENKDAESV